MDREFHCLICCEEYSSLQENHQPLVLPCGHTFCKQCLVTLTTKKCPLDNKSFNYMTVPHLPVNYSVLKLLEFKKKSLKQTSSSCKQPLSPHHVTSENKRMEELIQQKENIEIEILQIKHKNYLHEIELLENKKDSYILQLKTIEIQFEELNKKKNEITIQLKKVEKEMNLLQNDLFTLIKASNNSIN